MPAHPIPSMHNEETCDVLVLGAGAAGLMARWWLVSAVSGSRSSTTPTASARRSSSPVEAAATSPTFTPLPRTSSPPIRTSPALRSPATPHPISLRWSKNMASPTTKRPSASSSAIAPPPRSSTCSSGVPLRRSAHRSRAAYLGGRRCGGFSVRTATGSFRSAALVVATGGLSIPKMGATAFGYTLAQQFGLAIEPCRPALVPLTFGPADLDSYAALTGISAPGPSATTPHTPTARNSRRSCSSPIADSAARPSCRSLPTGSPARPCTSISRPARDGSRPCAPGPKAATPRQPSRPCAPFFLTGSPTGGSISTRQPTGPTARSR